MTNFRLRLTPTLAAALLAGATCLTLPACTGERDVPSLIADAKVQRDKGDLPAAVIQVKNAIQRDAAHAEARSLLGELHIEMGNAIAAEKELRRARDLGAPPASLTLLIGKSVLMQGQFERVLSEFPVSALAAERAGTLALRANAELGLGRPAAARAQFEQALALQRDMPEALLGMARLALQRESPEAASALMARALAANPGNIECLRFQGDLQRFQGKLELAMDSHRRILALRPHNAQAHVDIAHIHMEAARFPQAHAALAQARKSGGATVGVLYAEALASFRENKLPQSLESLQQLLRGAPDYYPGVLLAGTVQSALGANQQARQHLQKFLSAYPGHLYASKLMAMLHVGARETGAALALLRPLLEAHPEDVELLALAGETHLSARQFDAAAGYLEKASALRPQLPALHTALAMSRLGNGDGARAVAELERATALDGSNARTGLLLVMTHMRGGAPDKALAVAAAMEKQSNNPLIQNLKGGIYMAKNDAGKARASFEQALVLDPAYIPALANLAQLDQAEHKAGAAERRYQAALVKSPNNVALLEALSRLAMSDGKPAQAVAWLERAHREHPQQLATALRLADLYARLDQRDKTLRLAQQLQASHPQHPEALALLAQAFLLNRQYDAAAESYAKLSVLTPKSTLPHMRMASLHLTRQDDGAALAALRKALAIEPNLLDAHITTINILLRQKKFADALALANGLKQRQPKSPSAYKLEADVYSAQGQPALALKAYQQAFSMAPSGALLIQMHGALTKLGRIAEADERMTQWFAAHSNDVPTRLYYASSKLVQNQVKPAIAQFEAVLKHEPGHIVALNDLAWACHQSGDPRALGFAQRAHALAPASPSVMDTLGWIYLDSGDIARALPLLQKASALAPNASEIRFHLGVVLAKSGDKRGARRELEKLLASPSHFARRDEAKAMLAAL